MKALVIGFTVLALIVDLAGAALHIYIGNPLGGSYMILLSMVMVWSIVWLWRNC